MITREEAVEAGIDAFVEVATYDEKVATVALTSGPPDRVRERARSFVEAILGAASNALIPVSRGIGEGVSPDPWIVVPLGNGRANVVSGSDGSVATSASGACTFPDADFVARARNRLAPALLEVARIHHPNDGAVICYECGAPWPCRTARVVAP